MAQVYIVKQVPYLELSMLEGHQPWNVTCFITMPSTNVSITYTMITAIDRQPHLIGVMTSQSLQEVTIRPLLNEIDLLKQFLIP